MNTTFFLVIHAKASMYTTELDSLFSDINLVGEIILDRNILDICLIVVDGRMWRTKEHIFLEKMMDEYREMILNNHYRVNFPKRWGERILIKE